MIGKEAFTRCKQLTELTIPSSVKKIDSKAFSNTGLSYIEFEGEKEPLVCAINAFDSTNITIVNVPEEYGAKTFCGEKIEYGLNGVSSILISTLILLVMFFI